MATVTGSKRHLDITSDTLTTDLNITAGEKLFIGTTDANTTSTTALVLNSTEVEKRTLGSLAFDSTTLGTAATTASTDYATAAQGALADSALQSFDITTQTDSKYLRSDTADTASELITFSKGISSDGNSKFYNWRAIDNTSNSSNTYFRIARVTSSQSSRFMITLAGRSSSYADNSLPAMGHIVGQLNNDNNYDVVFYNHSTASSEVVTEVGIIDVTNTVVDIYVKVAQFAELTATGHISDGSFAVYSNAPADGDSSAPSGYTVVTEYISYNSGNFTPLTIGTTATTALAGNTSIPVSGTDFDPAGTDNSTDVTLDTSSYDYLSITGQEITLGQIDYDADITNLPTLGTAAAADTGDFATAAQGALADTALQSFDITTQTDSKYLRSNANDTLSSTLKVTGSVIYENNTSSGYIPFPKGAMYQTTTSGVTGAIKIKLPTHGTADMMTFVVEIYDYTSNESVTVFIAGYLYQTTNNNEWNNCTVRILANQTGKDYTVRFGADGSNNCVWIGETNSAWSYPQVMVRDFFAAYTADIDAYNDNWGISFVTSFDTVDETRSDNLPAADWDRIESKPSTFAPSAHTHSAADITSGTLADARIASAANWNEAYDNYITGVAVTGTGTKTITLTQRDGGTITDTFTDLSGAGGDGNDFLTDVTRSGNVLTFEVSNQTNPTYTFGSAAWTASTDYATAAQGSSADSALQSGDADLTPSWVPASDPSYLTSVAFSDLTTTPTTIAGYGITDAFDGAYSSLSGTPTIPSGNAIIDWTVSQTEDIHADNYTDTTYTVGDGGLTQKNFTTTLKTKLDGIAAGAEENVQSDWNATTGDAFIQNKPTLGTAAAADTGDFATATQGATADSALQPADIITFAGDGEGLVPDGTSADASKFLNGDAGWTVPTNTVTSVGVSGDLSTGNITLAGSGDVTVTKSGGTVTIDCSDTDTQYTAGAGLDLTGTSFSVEADLSSDVHTIGRDANDKYVVNTSNHAWYLDGVLDMRLANNGTLDVDGDVVAFSTVTNSDRRLKTDIETIENASEKVSKLRGVSYTWDHGKRKGQRDIGLIAQEVEEVVPEVVSEGELLDGTTAKRVDYAKLVGLLIESNKELQAQVNELKDRLDGITK